MLLQIFLVQIVTKTCPPKKKETNLYHEFRHCFVALSLYFLLRTQSERKASQGVLSSIKMFQDEETMCFPDARNHDRNVSHIQGFA